MVVKKPTRTFVVQLRDRNCFREYAIKETAERLELATKERPLEAVLKQRLFPYLKKGTVVTKVKEINGSVDCAQGSQAKRPRKQAKIQKQREAKKAGEQEEVDE